MKRFALAEIAPHAEEWDRGEEFPRDIFKKAGDLGLFGIRIDPELGGSGLDWWATTAYIEGLSYSENAGVNMALMVQSDMTLPVIDELGTAEQKQEFLKPAMKGDFIASLGISEPGGGSDVAAMKTTARIDGGDFVISGQKLWITNGTRADFIVLAVRTGEAGYKGITFVLVPTNTKGFSVGKKLKKIGNLSSDTAELFFDECRIPRSCLLGEMSRGFYYIMHNFQGERLVAAIAALAGMDRMIRPGARITGWSARRFRKPRSKVSSLETQIRRTPDEYRSRAVAGLSRRGSDESQAEVHPRSYHGEAVHVGIVPEGSL